MPIISVRSETLLRCFRLAAMMLVAVAGIPCVAFAQPDPASPQTRYIEELKQRNDDYGPGCNGIGITVPATLDIPESISTRWAAGHSACIPGLRMVTTCLGDIVGDDRIIGCTLRVADGQSATSLGCAQLTLITAGTRLTSVPELSNTLAVGSEGGARSCTEQVALLPGATVAAAFSVPAIESSGDLALLIEIDGSEVPAFLIPAGQVSGETAVNS